MPIVKTCKKCFFENHNRSKVCCGCGNRLSQGRPLGSTQETGFNVSSGRPRDSTQDSGCSVSSGRPRGRRKGIEFDPCIELPTDWDHSDEMLNVNCELLDACNRRIAQQRTFDKKPLGIAVCYGCGHMLWSTVDGAHTFLVNKPSGMTEDDAPATAYLTAVPNCSAGFVYTERGNSTKERWYCCPSCKSNQVPSDQHVGQVLDDSLNAKPIHDWDMSFPIEARSLANQYERGQMSLCGLFSSTVREASMTQYCHLQGEQSIS